MNAIAYTKSAVDFGGHVIYANPQFWGGEVHPCGLAFTDSPEIATAYENAGIAVKGLDSNESLSSAEVGGVKAPASVSPDPPAVEAAEVAPVVSDDDTALAMLKEQAQGMGIRVDGRWGAEKLSEEIQKKADAE